MKNPLPLLAFLQTYRAHQIEDTELIYANIREYMRKETEREEGTISLRQAQASR